MKPTSFLVLLAFVVLVLNACTPRQRAARGAYGPYRGGYSTLSEEDISNWQIRRAGSATTIKYLE